MKISESTERKIFIASAATTLFAVGLLIGSFAPPVRSLADRTGEKLEDIARNGPAYFGIRPSGHLEPIRRDILDAVHPDTALAAPGVTLVSGLFGDALRARLYDRNGEVIYEWPNNFFDLFPERRKYKFDALLHGDYLYPNGDLLVLIDGVGLARLNACGDVLWKSGNGAHHSIDVDDDGYIWTPRSSKSYDDARLANRPVRIDRIAKYDPATGKRVDSIELGKVLLDAGLEGIIKSNVPRPDDVFHLNDVEILKESMAPAFPMFAAGDIMLSGRNTNAIIVLDGKTHQVKWWRVGPMHGQHDPDFQPDGEITMLDNRTAGIAAKKNGFMGGGDGSRILAINPSTYDYREIYASNRYNRFYSAYRGKHQMLANGNVLVAESEAGRVFEATPDGRIAWQVVSNYDDNTVGWLTSATRYPENYASIGKNCPAK